MTTPSPSLEATSTPPPEVDYSAGRVGEVFAEALIGAAGNQAEAAVAELDALVNEVLAKNPRFEAVLVSEMVPAADKVGMLDRLFGGRLTPVVLNFLKVLVEHGRGNVLRAVLLAARQKLDVESRRVRVRVTSASALDEASARQIIDTIQRVTGSEPILERVVDPRVIGGAVFRIGDTVFDGSIANQLQRMRTQLLNRSVHEIQSGRDRFSPATGN